MADVAKYIGMGIALLFGVAMLPTLANTVQRTLVGDNVATINVTGAAASLLSLIPLMFIAFLVISSLIYLRKDKE